MNNLNNNKWAQVNLSFECVIGFDLIVCLDFWIFVNVAVGDVVLDAA